MGLTWDLQRTCIGTARNQHKDTFYVISMKKETDLSDVSENVAQTILR